MQNDLCGKRLVGNFLEWCDTPLIRKSGSSTTRWVLVVRRDRVGRPFRGASRGITTCTSPYHTPPATLSWPLTRTGCWSSSAPPFFDNAAALECQLAAICSTVRGVTIVRAFVTVGLDGVGQSLNTCLISNLCGGSHGFMDMNVFYTEDELRKQADTFTMAR